MLEELSKYKVEGYSFKQLMVLGKAQAQNIPLELIANKDLSAKEMQSLLYKEIKKRDNR